MVRKERKKVKSLSSVWLFGTPWTVARQAPPSLGFSSQEYWSGLPFPSPGDPPNPGIESGSPTLQVDALPSEPQTVRLLHPWDSPGKSAGVGCHCLLQGILPTQGLNLGLPHCRQTQAWRIPWTEEPDRVSPWGPKEWDTTEGLHFHFHFMVSKRSQK